MASNNLRLIYQNIADMPSTTVLASSTMTTATAASNILLDAKSLVWRSALSSTTNVKANLVITNTSNTVRGVILAFTNLSAAATIRVRGYTGIVPVMGGTVDTPTTVLSGVLMFDSGTVLANPYQSSGFSNWNNDTFYPVTSSSTTYTTRKVYSRVWIPTGVVCTSMLIEIIDPNNVNKYVEVSRLIAGDFWTPMYNTSYGLSTATRDLSTSDRSESGDLLTSIGAMYNTLNFDLKWLSPTDRIIFTKIIKLCGTQKPLFVSLFPDNTTEWDKEQTYQIYGKLSGTSNIEHPMFEIYSSQVEIEEI